MTLSAGQRLGPYEIVSPLGAGGMGEVYKARDTRLGRTVALKVLPERLTSDTELRQRFEREARTISQLSHPHICALYDVGHQDGTDYLVMEYLEGQTLAERLAKGPLSLDQTLRYGIEIADALDKAHRQGIVHRDLKPGNVMLTKSGVKLLDFGLAKALGPAAEASILTSLPTEMPLTEKGAILGTVQYMATEQLEGKEADARTDIFALGAVLYEMATGKKAFSGASQASLISAIMTSEPASVSSSQPMSPAALDVLVKTCLAKDPSERWQSAYDVALQLGAIAQGAPALRPGGVAAVSRRTGWLPWAIAAVSAIVASAVLLRAGSPRGPAATIRFSVPPPANGAFSYWVEGTYLAVSPDGSQLAYVARDQPGGQRIFVRPLSALEARPVMGTEGANSLFWAPDGRSIAFFAEGKLKRIGLSGGAAVPICDVPGGGGMSGTWGRGGEILFSAIQGPEIHRVSASGGSSEAVIRIDRSRGEERVLWPWFLPDGNRFLYLLHLRNGGGNLMLAEPGKAPRAIMPMASAVQYADPGYLVFSREGTLVGQRFDWRSGRLSGEPFSIAERVRYFLSSAAAAFAVSAAGTLAYQSQDNVSRLVWIDRTGRELGTVGTPGNYLNVSISPDGRRVLFDRGRPGIGTYDVWALDLERGTETPITTEPETETAPVWLPGGRSIVYSENRGAAPQLVRRDLATGKVEELLPGGSFHIAQDLSPDGKTLLYTERTGRGAFDVWTLPLSGGGKPAALLQSPVNKGAARFSRDGRFVAFISGESGAPEAYVMAYPGPGERIRVSTGGAWHVRWSRDGRELFYLSGDRQLMSVPVQTAPSLQLGTPTPLFTLGPKGWTNFEVSPDGKRFLAIVPAIIGNEFPLSVVVNWTAEAAK